MTIFNSPRSSPNDSSSCDFPSSFCRIHRDPDFEPLPGPPGFAQDKKLRIGLTVPTLVNPFFVGMDRGVREECQKLGYELIAPNANNDMATQANQMEDLITKKVDLIIICPINAEAIVPVVKKANAAKIPVVALDRGSAGGEMASFIETNNVEMGQKGADFIAEQLKKKYGSAKGNVVNLQGLRGTTAAESREKGIHRAAQEIS